MTDDYPHWRTALFGNGHVAYLYCAVKYTLWHLFHVLFVVVGVGVIVLTIPPLLGWRGLRYVAITAARRIDGWLQPRPDGGFERTVKMKATLETWKTTPVVRRIYNECPVDIKMDPLWFSRLSDAGEVLVDFLKPPEYEAVCPRCGDAWGDWKVGEPCFGCRVEISMEDLDENVPTYERQVKE